MRLIELLIAEEHIQKIEPALKEAWVIEKWSYESEFGKTGIKILTQDEYVKEILTALEQFPVDRILIYPIEGTLPKIKNPVNQESKKVKIGKFFSISKEELYNDIDKPMQLTTNFILMVILSAFVAGIGILKNNVVIVIGAMVIAPFLGPNISMAFGTSLGDWPIVKRSFITGIVATAIALAISVLWGMLASDINNIAPDPEITYQDIILALICGFAGVITVLSGQGSGLVGVMVAAALLPPLMRAGLLLGGGELLPAFNSMLIFTTNVVCLNIAGIITFYLAGIRPGNWWEKAIAKKKTRNAFLYWVLALLILSLIIMLMQGHFTFIKNF